MNHLVHLLRERIQAVEELRNRSLTRRTESFTAEVDEFHRLAHYNGQLAAFREILEKLEEKKG